MYTSLSRVAALISVLFMTSPTPSFSGDPPAVLQPETPAITLCSAFIRTCSCVCVTREKDREDKA